MPPASSRSTTRSRPVARSKAPKRVTKWTVQRRRVVTPPQPAVSPLTPPRGDTVAVTVIRSSPSLPVQSSPLPQQQSFDMDMDYNFRVKEGGRVTDGEVLPRDFFLLSILDDKFEQLAANPASRINGKHYRIVSRTVSFKAQVRGSTRVSHTLNDFSQAEEIRLFKRVDQYVRQWSNVSSVKFTFEVICECEALQRAYARGRYANEPSSDPPVETPVAPRTKRLLAEAKAAERIEVIASKTDWQSQITRMWECREPACNNYRQWCYVHQGTREHFKITAADTESWAMKLLEGNNGVTIGCPPIQLIEYWRTQGNQLKTNPNRNKSAKRRHSNSSSDSELRKIKQRLEMREIETRRNKLDQDEALHRERVNLQRQQLREAYGIREAERNLPAAIVPHDRPITPAAVAQQLSGQSTLSSSPVGGASQADTRATVRDFFEWLVKQQPIEDQDDYTTASEVAIEQKWTIRDLQKMDKPGSDLYTVAVATFKLKDGIVRHLREDIRRYKRQYRAARDIALLAQSLG